MNSTWNHRVVKHVDGTFGIHEAHYNNGELTSITENTVAPFGDDYSELGRDYTTFSTAFNRPVIDEAKFLEEKEKHSVTTFRCEGSICFKADCDNEWKELGNIISFTLGGMEDIRAIPIAIEPPAFMYDDEGVPHLP